MMKEKLSYESAAARLKTLRPVVSLNAGFETQLQCLERAKCDVLNAHQLHLQHKLAKLAQQHLDGTLEMTSQKKRRQHAVPRTPPHPSIPTRSRFEPSVTCCDDRGMLDGNLPGGFCLSLPFTSKAIHFIPALRSMGSMFGCRTCGEHLFCASAIVQHSAGSDLKHPSSDLLPSSCSSPRDRKTEACFVERSGGNDTATEQDPITARSETEMESPNPPAKHEAEIKKKTPLLAKLRLRPQSPSVSSPTGSAKSTPRAADGKSSCTDVDSQPTTIPVGAADKASRSEDAAEPRGGVLKNLKKETPRHQIAKPGREESSPKNLSSADSTGSSNHKAAEGFWRTLTAFKATKRIFKDGKDKKHSPSSDSSVDDEKKRAMATDVDGNEDLSHAQFLRDNAAAWERSIRMIEKSSDEEGAALVQIAATIAADAKMMSMLDCEEWFVEPQAWFMDHLIKSPSGAIRCPNEECNAVVGQWRWDGLRCVYLL